jgi:hypothetical protein
VEGSLDGKSWTEMDGKMDNENFPRDNTLSFTVLKPVESRFIRLTETGKTHGGYYNLFLHGVEFFGTISQ